MVGSEMFLSVSDFLCILLFLETLEILNILKVTQERAYLNVCINQTYKPFIKTFLKRGCLQWG